MQFAVVRTYSHAMEAQMARGALQAAGIDAQIADEHLVTQDWLLSNAVGGVRLQVPEADLESARRIIAEIDADAIRDEQRLICPNCDSDETRYEPPGPFKKAFLVFAIIITGGFALLLRPAYKHCDACGAKWG